MAEDQRSEEARLLEDIRKAGKAFPVADYSRKLTEKECRIADLVAQGLSNKEIADIFGTSEQVVKNKLRRIYGKTNIHSRVKFVLWWLKNDRTDAD